MLIDWFTVAAQIVNFLILVYLLKRFLYGPLIRAMDAREKRIADELGTSRLQPVILVGAGHLGLALLSYRGFEKEGFEIVAAFDAEPERKRDKETKQPIYGMDELAAFVKNQKIKMAILTVPAAAAQEVANRLVQPGITGILNFSPIVLSVPEKVMVNNVNLAIELENLSYFTQE